MMNWKQQTQQITIKHPNPEGYILLLEHCLSCDHVLMPGIDFRHREQRNILTFLVIHIQLFYKVLTKLNRLSSHMGKRS